MGFPGGTSQAGDPDEQGGQRLDQALSPCCRFSRTASELEPRTQDRGGRCLGTTRMKVSGGESVGSRSSPIPTPRRCTEAIPLDVVVRDPVLLVIDMAAGLVVHPGAATSRHAVSPFATVPQVAELPRAGIVHRLARTLGLLSLPNPHVATMLVRQLRRARQARITGPWCMARSTTAAPSMRRWRAIPTTA